VYRIIQVDETIGEILFVAILFSTDVRVILFERWVKDFTDPCDCIKDSDDSQPVKKT